jgi:iron complex transport system substrate-binding protein
MRGHRRAAALLVAVASVGVGACAGGSATTTPAAGPAVGEPGTVSAEAVFPVSIPHRYGTTEIPTRPERVAVVGLVEQDILLALDIVPVATTEWFGEHPGAVFPWAVDELGDAPAPEVMTAADGYQFEKVASVRPDLIVGLYSGMTQADYDTLSQIAPTIAQPASQVDYGTSWQEVSRTVGRAVGRAGQAEHLVDDLEDRIAEARAAHPEFAGASAIMATPYEGIYLYGPQDLRTRLIDSLGFTPPPVLAEIAGDSFGGNLSAERTEVLDVDVLVWLLDSFEENRAPIEANPLYTNLDVHTQGRVVFQGGAEDSFYQATPFITVLGLPFLLDGLVPQLAAAVDGDPATPVPPAPALPR